MSWKYEEFNNNYQQLSSSNNNLSESEIFDYFLVPFVSALGYKPSSPNLERNLGDMIVQHNVNEQKIIAHPDNYSKIIFKIGNDQIKEKYSDNTLIILINTKQEKINFIIPYFGQYVVSKTINFTNDENGYNSIQPLIVLSSRKNMPDEMQKVLFSQLATSYDISLPDDTKSQLLLYELNKMLKGANNSLIQILALTINSETKIDTKYISDRLTKVLQSQTQDNYYQLDYSQDLKKLVEQQNSIKQKEIKKEEPKKTSSVMDVFKQVQEGDETSERESENQKPSDPTDLFQIR